MTALLRQAPQLGALDRIAEDEARQSWPVRYHLSPERSNLLRHLDFSGLDVLELGAGMGGVSRFLAERARHLTVVEGSQRRFDGLGERLRDLDNWTGWVGRIEDYASDRRFDVVCLVGVLEYAERLVDTPEDFAGDAFDYVLARARAHLADDGVLLLAIENQLGLKYWSGAAEDHSGALFDGIAGYARRPVARTFSRRGLAHRLATAGLSVEREFLPFPDYKLPSSIVDAELARLDPELVADLACFRPFADHQRRRSQLFPDVLALSELADAGLFAEFANSFLVAAAPTAGGRRVLDRLTADHRTEGGRLQAWHFSPVRRRATVTRFDVVGEQVCVEKESFGDGWEPTAEDDGEPVARWQAPERAEVARGERLRARLVRQLYFDQADGFLDELEGFLRWCCGHFADDGSVAQLDGAAIDALVRNAVRHPEGEGYQLFDQEWRLATPLSTSWFVLRNVLSLVDELPFFPSAEGLRRLSDLYRRLCERLEVAADLEADLDREVRFRTWVSGQEREAIDGELRHVLEIPFLDHRALPRDPEFLLHWRSLTSGLTEALAAREEAVTWLEQVGRDQEEAIAVQRRAIEWLEGVRDQLEGQRVELQQAVDWLRSETERQEAKLAHWRREADQHEAEAERWRRRAFNREAEAERWRREAERWHGVAHAPLWRVVGRRLRDWLTGWRGRGIASQTQESP